MAACPCGSGAAFADCCRPYLRGEGAAPTAEALMRSRYTAYVRRDSAYLLRTWHPDTRPATLDVEGGAWLGLEVLATNKGQADDARGTVAFAAHYVGEGNHAGEGPESGTMREVSTFVRGGDGAWLYLDGEHQ